MTTFLIGLVVGLSIGLVFTALMVERSRADAEYDAYLRRLQHTCTDRCRPVMERHFDEQGRRVA